MSLVAYDSSSESGEETDIDDGINYEPACEDTDFIDRGFETADINDCDDDNYVCGDSSRTNLFSADKEFNLALNNQNIYALLKRKLPAAAATGNKNGKTIEIQEDDDEFLHKKSLRAPEKPPRPPTKITIPSLLDFSAQLNKIDSKKLIKNSSKTTQSTFSLLGLLPKPRTENDDAIRNTPGPSNAVSTFIPESVKNRLSEIKNVRPNPTKLKLNHFSQTNSDDSDEGDYFSLNKKDDLPTVSSDDIDDMVAQKAVKISEATFKFDELPSNSVEVTEAAMDYAVNNNPSPSCNNLQIDQKAIHALVGSQAKKRRKIVDVEIKELSSDEILPGRNEWLRSALASETTYQPKGMLIDEEPAAGTRKKHQITYLAHQAKANEAELQAMWATNRQNRRATANKYGF